MWDSMFSVEMFLGNNNNKGNHIILLCTTCKAFHRERRADIEQLMQSTALSPLSIQDLIVELIKICNTNIVNLASHDTCMCMKPTIILFLFEFERCVEHAYFWLCQNNRMVNVKFKQFVIILKR